MQVSDLQLLSDAPLSVGSRVLLRLDLNVPCDKGRVLDAYRIERAFKTIEFLRDRGCRTLMISHIEGGSDTLKPVYLFLQERLDIRFASGLAVAGTMMRNVPNGGFLLLENIRHEEGETENSEALARSLAALGEFYVSDAFAVSHRTHTSIVGVPTYVPAFAGFLLADEVEHLSLAIHPPKPSLFILGGAKFETKLPLVLKFLDRYDRVFLGGALANDAFSAMGLKLGASLVSQMALDLHVILNRPNLRLPLDFIVARDGKSFEQGATGVLAHDRVVDCGEKTNDFLESLVSESKFVLWNGPLGEYERGFSASTEMLAKTIARSAVTSIIGGGDTIAAVSKLKLLSDFTFVSTGGGAMLEFLSTETLPGLEVLKKVNTGLS